MGENGVGEIGFIGKKKTKEKSLIRHLKINYAVSEKSKSSDFKGLKQNFVKVNKTFEMNGLDRNERK